GDAPLADAGHVPPAHQDLPARGRLRAEHEAKECRLSRTRGAGEEHELTFLHREVHVDQRGRVARVRLGDVEHLDHRESVRLDCCRTALARPREGGFRARLGVKSPSMSDEFQFPGPGLEAEQAPVPLPKQRSPLVLPWMVAGLAVVALLVVSLYAKKVIDDQAARAYQAMRMGDGDGFRASKRRWG